MTHREELWNKAQKALFEKYGEHPDISIVNRFLSEKIFLAGVVEYFDELASIIKESVEVYDEKLLAKSNVSNCFVAYLLGASDICPLPPHWICPRCRRLIWADRSDCVFDMRRARTCECSGEMHADGFDLPWEIYLPYSKILQRKEPLPNTYSDLFNALTKKHFQFSLLNVAQACHKLEQSTGISLDEIESDRKVKNLLLSGDFSCAHPKMEAFLKSACEVVSLQNYDAVLSLIGMAHGTQTWKNNSDELLLSGKCKLAHIPATRDDLYTSLQTLCSVLEDQSDIGFALDLTEKTRNGFYAEHEGMDNYTADTLRRLGYDEWFISYLSRVRYMSTKALAAIELRFIIILTYFKMYCPKEFEETLSGGDIWEGGENNG